MFSKKKGEKENEIKSMPNGCRDSDHFGRVIDWMQTSN
jgi:hypothetical protein